MSWWPVVLMLAVVCVRFLLDKNLRQCIPWDNKLEEISAKDWPTVCAWMTGGPQRMYEYGYALLSSSGAVRNSNDICVKIHLPSSKRQEWPKWVQQAYDALPPALPMEDLPKAWLPFVHQWEIALLEKGYLLKPSAPMVRLYRMLMGMLVLFNMAMLYLWGMPWHVWVMSAAFWSVLGAWLFFSHLPTMMAPAAILKVKAQRQELMEQTLQYTPHHMLAVLALEGPQVLRGTPLEEHVLPLHLI